MQAAKKAREEQLKVYEAFISGEEVVFKNHQGGGYPCKYDPSVYAKEKSQPKVSIQDQIVFLDAAANCDADTVLKFLNAGMDPNVANADGLTALHQCCIENSLKVASVLLSKGADVNARDADWWTPLHAASACGHWRVVNFLLASGAHPAPVNADGDLPIDIVDGQKTAQILTDEMARFVAVDDEEALEELRRAPYRTLKELVESMIANHEDVNTTDSHGVNALHSAACSGYLDIIELLLANGADINAPDREGFTALHLATLFQQYKVVELLGRRGANPEARNKFHETPIVLTEDVTLIRLLKGMASVSGNGSEESQEPRSKRSSSVKRMSLSQKQHAAKADSMRERTHISAIDRRDTPSQYASLQFDLDDTDSPKTDSLKPDKHDDGPVGVTYASIDPAATLHQQKDSSHSLNIQPPNVYAEPMAGPLQASPHTDTHQPQQVWPLLSSFSSFSPAFLSFCFRFSLLSSSPSFSLFLRLPLAGYCSRT
eukprot:m.655446 g.655446  ORF g.655446 m.655446 type:complete len:488 (-) comp58420_c0_seq3:398-1861(-)